MKSKILFLVVIIFTYLVYEELNGQLNNHISSVIMESGDDSYHSKYGYTLKEKDVVKTTGFEKTNLALVNNRFQIVQNQSVIVIFECESCNLKNKLAISGKENHTWEKIKFPFKQSLKPGKYEMIYWQKKVQQIRLPFTVGQDSINVIRVK